MLRRASWLIPALALSCAVRGFSIVDELPGAGGGAGGNAAGVSSGASSSSGNAGSGGDGGSSAGKAQGGQAPQAGSPSQGGAPATEAGAPSTGEAGAGGDSGTEPGGVEPCAPDQSGFSPMFCDDFEQPTLNPPRWMVPGGMMAETTTGPHGTETRALQLLNFQATPGVGDFNLQAAGSEVTVSFWARSIGSAPQGSNLISFRDRSGGSTRLRLVHKLDGLFFVSSTMLQAPSQAGEPLPVDIWICVSVYMTTSSIQVTYGDAGGNLRSEFTLDSTPTPGVDDAWLNQSVDQRTIAGFPAFGTDPVLPGAFWLDDVRIVRDRSSVCGF